MCSSCSATFSVSSASHPLSRCSFANLFYLSSLAFTANAHQTLFVSFRCGLLQRRRNGKGTTQHTHTPSFPFSLSRFRAYESKKRERRYELSLQCVRERKTSDFERERERGYEIYGISCFSCTLLFQLFDRHNVNRWSVGNPRISIQIQTSETC